MAYDMTNGGSSGGGLHIKNNFLQDLISAGNDAHSNLFEIEFSEGKFSKESGENSKFSVRVGTFTPPDFSQDKYTVRYVTSYIDRPVAKAKVNRSFPITFRVDSNWSLYKTLVDQKSVTSNFDESFVNTEITTDAMKKNLFNVTVYAAENGMHSTTVNREKLFFFRYCWIESITPDGFGADSKPINVTCQVHFLEMFDRQTKFPS